MPEKKVQLTHPKLPGQDIWVRESGVAARERAGWQRVGSKRTRPAAAAAAVTAETKKES